MSTFNNLAVALDFVVGDTNGVHYDDAFKALSSFEYGGYNNEGEWEDHSYTPEQIREYLDHMTV